MKKRARKMGREREEREGGRGRKGSMGGEVLKGRQREGSRGIKTG